MNPIQEKLRKIFGRSNQNNSRRFSTQELEADKENNPCSANCDVGEIIAVN